MTQTAHPPGQRRRRWFMGLGVFVVLLLAAIGVAAWMAHDVIEGRVRTATINLLQARFDSDVELGEVDLQLRPSLRARFEGLALHQRGRSDIPPLIRIRAFTLEADLFELWQRRIDRVHIEGMDIVIPPRRGDDMPKVKKDEEAPKNPTATTEAQAEKAAPPLDNRPDALIRELLSEDATLTIMPKVEGKRPREFVLQRIRLEDLQFAKPTPFQASLTNPIPTGQIETMGTFGPWQTEEPSLTPVTGTFTFDADLGTIKGIGGALDAEGSYSGPLERLSTSGRTHTPDFRVAVLDANPLPLETTFEATVDGTNGDVMLDKVDALLGGSRFLVKGPIVGKKGVKGRHITLDVNAERATLDDILRLTMKGTPVMTGGLGIHATLDLPPNEKDLDVIERMALDGNFAIQKARFTNPEVQSKIDELARRGQGRPKDESVDDVLSDLRGRVRMSNGNMRLSNLTFRVQGAAVAMDGGYNLRTEKLDFRGDVRLQASASQTMTGYKSWLLKPFDPLLRKRGAGTRLAIKVTGSRDKPEFGLELGRTLRGK